MDWRFNGKKLLIVTFLITWLSFALEIVLLFTGRRRSSVDPDQALQEALRTRLRVVESNSQDVIQLFKVSKALSLLRHCWNKIEIVVGHAGIWHNALCFMFYVICENGWLLLSSCRTCLRVWCLSTLRRIASYSHLRLWRKSGSFQHI